MTWAWTLPAVRAGDRRARQAAHRDEAIRPACPVRAASAMVRMLQEPQSDTLPMAQATPHPTISQTPISMTKSIISAASASEFGSAGEATASSRPDSSIAAPGLAPRTEKNGKNGSIHGPGGASTGAQSMQLSSINS